MSHKSLLFRAFHALLATIVIVNSFLPAVASAKGVELPRHAPAQEAAPIDDALNQPVEEVPTEAPVEEVAPSIPALLELKLDTEVLVPGSVANLTVEASNLTEWSTAGWQLTLSLPTEVKPSAVDQPLQWALPEFTENAPFQQVIALQMAPNVTQGGPVEIMATIQPTDDLNPISATVEIGILRDAAASVEADAALVETEQSSEGAVLVAAEGQIVLFSDAESVPEGTTLSFTHVQRWQREKEEAEPNTVPPSAVDTATTSTNITETTAVTPVVAEPVVTNTTTTTATDTITADTITTDTTTSDTVVPGAVITDTSVISPVESSIVTNPVEAIVTAAEATATTVTNTLTVTVGTTISATAVNLNGRTFLPLVNSGERPQTDAAEVGQADLPAAVPQQVDTTSPATAPAAEALPAAGTKVLLPVIAAAGANAEIQASSVQNSVELTATTPFTDGEVFAGVPAAALEETAEAEGVLVDQAKVFYHIWQLDATRNGEAISDFAEPMKLIVDVKWLEEQGILPQNLQLYTRKTETDDWALVDAEYDRESKQFTAEIEHFSLYGLANGMTDSGEILPSMTNFSTDLSSGSATINYPIETPVGLGGMTPNLSLSYSSQGVDDIVRSAGDTNFEIQGGLPGYGWSLGGLSYIVEADQHTYMVLNGMRVRISSNGDTSPHIFAKIQKNLVNTGLQKGLGEWTVTMPDGTKYIFGASPTQQVWNWSATEYLPLETMLTEEFVSTKWVTKRKVVKWLLREAIDPLGNRMEYQYKGYQGFVAGSCVRGDNQWGDPSTRWYHSATRPEAVYWSKNGSSAAKMRIDFDYDTRTDYKVAGWDGYECTQTKYSRYRLTEMKVQVLVGSSWHTLNKYTLGQSYSRASEKTHLKLNSINHYGEGGSDLLDTQSFTYAERDSKLNNLRLLTANNGWGGVATYTYAAQGVRSCKISESNQQTDCQNKTRYPVQKISVADGVGTTTSTNYGYNDALERREPDGLNFMGHRKASAQHLGSSGGEISFEEHWFHQVSGDAEYGPALTTAQMDAAIKNPDPALGKTKSMRIWQLPAQATADGSCGGRQTGTSANRCLMEQVQTTWAALTGSGANWSTSGVTYNSHPRWVQLVAESTHVDGITNNKRYFYEPERQKGQTGQNQQFGNVTKVEEHTSNSGSSTRLRAVATDYYPNLGAYIVNLPARVRVYGPGGDCYSEVQNVYGAGNVEGTFKTTPTSSLLIKSQQKLSGACSTSSGDLMPSSSYDAGWAITRYAYDTWGNQTTVNRTGVSSATNQVISTEYDPTYHLFSTRRWNAGNATYEETAYYFGINGPSTSDGRAYWGAMAEFCGVNDVCSRQAYDNFGRPTRSWEGVAHADSWSTNTDTNANVQWSYHQRGSAAGLNTNMTVEWRNPRGEGNFVRRHYNGLGQLVQEQTPSQNWTSSNTTSAEIKVSYMYDGLGRQVRQSVPLYAGYGTHHNVSANWTAGYSSTSYDALGRTLVSKAPNGELTRTKYAGRSVAVVAVGRNGTPDRVIAWQETNGLGQLQTVRTYNKPYDQGGTPQGTVMLTHDPADRLLNVTNAAGGTSTMSYDLGGRKTRMVDGDLGTWNYVYDRQGHLTRQTDACGNQTNLSYNTLDQLTGKSFIKGSNGNCNTPAVVYSSVSYAYGGGTANRGQLTQVRYSNGSYQKDLTYNGDGQLASEKVTITGGAGGGYTTSYGYDTYLRPNKITYPDGEQVTTSYNGMGLPKALSSNTGGTLVDATAYDAAARLTSMRFPAGGDLYRTQSYWPWVSTADNSNGRLKEIMVGTSAGSSNRLYFLYGYDAFGNVGGMSEKYNNGATTTYTFGYDAQNRLTKGYDNTATSGNDGRSYSYDVAGRLTNYEGLTLQSSTSFPRHAVKNSGYAYDANGNIKTGGGRTLVWNVENRLHSAAGETYLYNENGIRLKKTVGSTSVYYPFSHYEPVVSGGTTTITKYYFFGGQRVAMKKGSTLTYLHSDHLGGTALETNSSGNVTADQTYWAYGKQRDAGTVSTSRRFTGQVYDGSGLYYYNARYYDPGLGVFVSPDTIVPEPGQVVDYNRYAYARLNPLKYSDPSGHNPTSPTFDQWGGGGAGSSALMYALVRGLQVAQTQGPQVAQIGAQTQEIYPAVVDWVTAPSNTQGGLSLLQAASNAASNASQNAPQFDPGNFNFNPDPGDPNGWTNWLARGREAHRQFRQEVRNQMQALGREEKAGDFLTEKAIRDGNGNVVRIGLRFGKPDAVDYKNHIIYDLKPWRPGGIPAIRAEYTDQFQRYIDLYRQAYGVDPQIVIVPYGGP